MTQRESNQEKETLRHFRAGMMVHCLDAGEAGRELPGEVWDSDTPPCEFSSSTLVIPPEQIIKYHIWKKVLFYIIMMAVGRTRTQPRTPCGRAEFDSWPSP